MKIIAFEEHMIEKELTGVSRHAILGLAPYYADSLGKDLPYFPDFEVYADLGEKRIADMDRNGITMQVLSCPAETGLLAPEVSVPLTMRVNDTLSAAVKAHPDRFLAFATLPWTDPKMAALELKRAVTQLGLSGALLAGRPDTGPLFLDNPQYEPILAMAEKLEVPIYIHPGTPYPAVQETYYGGLQPEITARVSLFGWGWHNEAGIQVLRMILAGVFEKFPKLQIISGHWGEFVPYYLARLDQALPQKCTGLSRSITETYAGHIFVTPSGIFTDAHIHFIRETIGIERILFSVDFPLVPNENARSFLEKADISPREREMIAFLNARQLIH